MSENKVMYKFESLTQRFMTVIVRGFKTKVRFTQPYMGGRSEYRTTDPVLAGEIRKCQAFKMGQITELTPEDMNPPKPKQEKPAVAAPVEEEKPKEVPKWMQGSMKRITTNPVTDAQGTKDGDGVGTPVTGTVAGQQDLFGSSMQLGDVENLMDAKSYLRDVLKVDNSEIRTKDQTRAYCKEHGIEFPNYTFE